MYKCCWNCANGFSIAASTSEEMKRSSVHERACCAPRPVSNRRENPFKQRYCTQFEPDVYYRRYHIISRKEAEMLDKMTVDELMEYWNVI